MLKGKLNGRPVEVINSDWTGEEVQVLEAQFLDGMEENLNEEELLKFEARYQDELQQEAMECRADAFHDYLKDREEEKFNE
jgi:hypothetical protein